MKRLFIPLDKIELFDWCHKKDGDGFTVDAQADGQDWKAHRDGIDYIKTVLAAGQKIRPILVADLENGRYQRLDGFKRAWAHKELGEKFIEAFVATKKEYDGREEIPYGHSHIRAYHGGLPKEEFGLFEGDEKQDFDYENVKFLFKSPNHDGLRIELCECIHIHWGEYGRYRLDVGRKDFEALAEAISQI